MRPRAACRPPKTNFINRISRLAAPSRASYNLITKPIRSSPQCSSIKLLNRLLQLGVLIRQSLILVTLSDQSKNLLSNSQSITIKTRTKTPCIRAAQSSSNRQMSVDYLPQRESQRSTRCPASRRPLAAPQPFARFRPRL